MKGTCPACGFGAGLEAFLADAEWREAVLAAAALPSDCGTLAIRYVGLFRPGKRALTPDRAARLIREVCEIITSGVDFDRRRIEAPSHVWRAALIEMLNKTDLRRPIKNHNYLLRIVESRLAARTDMQQVERAETRRLSEEQRVRSGGMSHVATQLLPQIPEGERAERLERARAVLLEEGFNPKFLAEPLIEQKAREMYAEEVAS